LATGELFDKSLFENDLHGGSAGFVWTKGAHTMLFGAEFSRGKEDVSFRFPSAPDVDLETEIREDWAVYFNDTITWEKLTITPGLRYDHLSISDFFSDDLLNPSLGMTYKLEDETLFRATVAHGFIRPVIGFVDTPDLETEDIWSYQAGIESGRFKDIHLKAAVFYHRQDKTLYYNADNGLWENGGISERTGGELNAAVSPFENFTTNLGLSYIRVEPFSYESDDTYSVDMKLNYSTGRFGSLTLFGRYLWWPEYETSLSPRYDDMVLDLHYNKDIYKTAMTTTNFFVSVRNLFNGSYYWSAEFKNPQRWVEAGLRVNF
jgi:outer membrane receptor protein involved in Fe transport